MKKEEYLGYTLIHVNYPSRETIDKWIENINKLFEEKYGAVEIKEDELK